MQPFKLMLLKGEIYIYGLKHLFFFSSVSQKFKIMVLEGQWSKVVGKNSSLPLSISGGSQCSEDYFYWGDSFRVVTLNKKQILKFYIMWCSLYLYK